MLVTWFSEQDSGSKNIKQSTYLYCSFYQNCLLFSFHVIFQTALSSLISLKAVPILLLLWCVMISPKHAVPKPATTYWQGASHDRGPVMSPNIKDHTWVPARRILNSKLIWQFSREWPQLWRCGELFLQFCYVMSYRSIARYSSGRVTGQATDPGFYGT